MMTDMLTISLQEMISVALEGPPVVVMDYLESIENKKCFNE